mmetsp:Transcript_14474/g.16305  ORF Transcript_14474/g.16305 Transcript_14474/m.16305 type:complete len:83 (+) Transcript_14474:377-625(+)
MEGEDDGLIFILIVVVVMAGIVICRTRNCGTKLWFFVNMVANSITVINVLDSSKHCLCSFVLMKEAFLFELKESVQSGFMNG